MIEYLLWAPDRGSFLAIMADLVNPVSGEPLASVDKETGRLVPSAGVRIDELGPIVRTPAVLNDGGVEISPAEVVAGWHVNMVAYGALAAAIQGSFLFTIHLFQTTRLLAFLGDMWWVPSTVGAPEGFLGLSGVKVFDPQAPHRRARVWA